MCQEFSCFQFKYDGTIGNFDSDTNLEIEEGQQPTLVVRVNLNGRDRDFDEFGQEEKKEKKLKSNWLLSIRNQVS